MAARARSRSRSERPLDVTEIAELPPAGRRTRQLRASTRGCPATFLLDATKRTERLLDVSLMNPWRAR